MQPPSTLEKLVVLRFERYARRLSIRHSHLTTFNDTGGGESTSLGSGFCQQDEVHNTTLPTKFVLHYVVSREVRDFLTAPLVVRIKH